MQVLHHFLGFHQRVVLKFVKNQIIGLVNVKREKFHTLEARVSCSGLPVAADRTEENNLTLLKSDTCIEETDLIKNSLTWALWLFAVFAALEFVELVAVVVDGCSMLNTDAIPMIVLAIVFKFPLCKLLRNGDLGSFDRMSPSKSLAKF